MEGERCPGRVHSGSFSPRRRGRLSGIFRRRRLLRMRGRGLQSSWKQTNRTARAFQHIETLLSVQAHLYQQSLIRAINHGFARRRNFFRRILRAIDLLPNSFSIAKKWNISDHDRRVRDGSITYDRFDVGEDRIEYHISKCVYIEMFEAYGIRGLCRIFCMTDTTSYEHLRRHVTFIRHSDLSDGEECYDEIVRRRKPQ